MNIEKAKLGSIATVTMGQSPPGDTYNTTGKGMPFFQGKSEFGEVNPVPTKWCTSPTRTALAGDILFSVRAPVGPTNLADQECCIGRGLAAIRPDPALMERDYLWLFLRHSEGTLQEMGQGSTFEAINGDDLRGLPVPIPTLTVQRQLATRLLEQLGEADTARRAVQTQWKAATALRSKCLEALFAHAGGSISISAVAKLQSGYAFKSDEFRTAGVRLLRNANILPGRVYWDDAVFLSEAGAARYPGYVLNDGDVLISLDRPIISSGIKVARVRSADLPALLVQRVGRFLINPAELDADYLYAYLQTDRFISAISGHEQSVGVPHISPSQVEAVEIPLPELAVQKRLAKRLNEISREWAVAAAAMQSQLKDLEQLPQRILAQAFDS